MQTFFKAFAERLTHTLQGASNADVGYIGLASCWDVLLTLRTRPEPRCPVTVTQAKKHSDNELRDLVTRQKQRLSGFSYSLIPDRVPGPHNLRLTELPQQTFSRSQARRLCAWVQRANYGCRFAQVFRRCCGYGMTRSLSSGAAPRQLGRPIKRKPESVRSLNRLG